MIAASGARQKSTTLWGNGSPKKNTKKLPAKTMSDMELYEAIGKMSDSELVELLCKIADEVELRLLYGTPLDDKSDL